MSLEGNSQQHRDDDEDVEYALAQLDNLLGLDSITISNDSDFDTTLDEKAKLVLHRLLSNTTDHSYSKVIDDQQITSGRPKEMPQLLNLSNKISTTSHRDIPSCTSLSSFSKISYVRHERNRFNSILNSHDNGNFRKVSSTLLRTASQVNGYQASSSSPSSYHQSGNVKEHSRHLTNDKGNFRKISSNLLRTASQVNDYQASSSPSSYHQSGNVKEQSRHLTHDKGNFRKVSSNLLRTASQVNDYQASSSSPSSYHQSGNVKEQSRHLITPLPALLELETPNGSTRKCVSRRRKNTLERRRRRRRTSASPSFSSSYSCSPSSTTQKQANSASSSSTSGGNERRPSMRGSRRQRSMRGSRRITINPSHNKEEEEQQQDIGRFQRFKNKLGLIFHHHHHHHHHHHESEADHVTSNKALSRHNHSFWNYFPKMTHGTPTTSRKDKAGGVVDGLTKHVWRSRKTDKKLKHSHSRSSAVVVNKWHWWQKFYKRKGVVRQNSNNRKRGKVKFGFTAAKRPPRVPALKFN